MRRHPLVAVVGVLRVKDSRHELSLQTASKNVIQRQKVEADCRSEMTISCWPMVGIAAVIPRIGPPNQPENGKESNGTSA